MIEKVLACCVMQNSKSNKIWGIAAINWDTWTFITFHGAIGKQLKFTKTELASLRWASLYSRDGKIKYVKTNIERETRPKIRKGYIEVTTNNLDTIHEGLKQSVEDVIMFATLSL